MNKKCALIMNRSDFLKRASSSGLGISYVRISFYAKSLEYKFSLTDFIC